MKSSLLRSAAFAALVGLGALTQAQAAEYTAIDPAASRITFAYKQMQVGMNGKFAKFDADLRFDPAKPAAGHANVKVTLASIDAGSKEATASAGAKKWLDTGANPLATFESTQIKALGGNRFEATGKLTIKGKSQEARSVFTVTEQGPQAVIEGSLPIKRSAFGIGTGDWADPSIVAEDVSIGYRLTAVAR
ncbi:MAG: Protein YceI [Paracidovorax wautersii]|uniref:Protein YceI n=1 Tax=Paracidovorax wautersii TaxID=1177982 RepID=A0A7V8FQK1_9BURK|nr:MAG: Protein YceI [Paracidovorax wautersii]